MFSRPEVALGHTTGHGNYGMLSAEFLANDV